MKCVYTAVPLLCALRHVVAQINTDDIDTLLQYDPDLAKVFGDLRPLNPGLVMSQFASGATPICHKLALKGDLPERKLGFHGVECFAHELTLIRRVCVQVMCLINSYYAELEHCLSKHPKRQDGGLCVPYVDTQFPVHQRYFLFSACAVGLPGGLTQLKTSRFASAPCFPMKASLYADIDTWVHNFMHKQLDLLRKGAVARTISRNLADYMSQMGYFVEMLQTLWWLYGSVMRLPIPAINTTTWPTFRLPPWDVQHRSSEALAELVRKVRQERSGQRLAIAEVGVFLANTSAALASSAGDALAEYHLVDSWNETGGMTWALLWQARQNDTGEQIMTEVWQKMEALPNVSVCANTAEGCCREAAGERCTSVVLHRLPSIEGAKRFERDSLDIVFVDGGHEYEDVRADLAAWWPKVRPGGILAGHDFSLQHDGVPTAVSEFLSRRQPIEIFLDADTTFWFRRPLQQVA
eukprot:TRINITY_DN74085_c0_g1_i1.p1 TRINITY_DN74085_c0_g1~~TRINITY_DN74085_c0_g1_i1.p1  ORF type:complete len:466 (-),score=66.54 TRINITY_DN74085_c0_g1_i1:607-2004(-)